MQHLKVLVSYLLSGDVTATETAGVEYLWRRIRAITLAYGCFQISQILIHNPIAPNLFGDFRFFPLVGNQFISGGNVDSVYVGITNRRGRTREVDILRSGITRHLHNLTSGRTTHHGIINEKDVAACKLALDGVQLQPHTFLPRGLSRHDERSRYVAIFYEPLPERPSQHVRRLQRTRPRRVRNGNDDINVVFRVHSHDFGREQFAHFEAAFVDGYTIHDGVGTGEVHIFEDAWGQTGGGGAHFGLAVAGFHVDEDGLAGFHVPHEGESKGVNRHRFACHAVVQSLSCL
mmetsp:Transcript_51595/g.76466  ORF Transcript_51595/g.76466 Transcript_51595/m.76466 type:complete len:289 (+) Transcript_51595:240-1106(+)